MRRKHLILASCIISALLLTFTFHVSADENVEADAGAASNSAPLLDSYFWENYDLLPYIESNSFQYINTGIDPDSEHELYVKFTFSEFNDQVTDNYLFGITENGLGNYSCFIDRSNGTYRLYLSNYNQICSDDLSPYLIHEIVMNEDGAYFDNDLMITASSAYDFSLNMYLFARNNNNSPSNYGYFRVYTLSYYDPANAEYVKYYYPAKSKSGDVIGLYDAISKTFVTSATQNAFVNPADDKVVHFQIGSFITSGLGWIGDILDFAIQEPMILMFMAIGLCGVAFRWARRVVHF